LTGADGITTLSVEPGIPPGDQLPAVFQAAFVAPVHVFCAKIPFAMSKKMINKRRDKFFITFIF
jgi:hypothetical protein